ncbi:M48 family metalloprotease [Sphaerisporangium sp. B11E5]|uniref:M48 family metalloprotease n=1 Tax=Sphaerisporangium sp. B11E5 TaxID=3153563 RepID=UPI00325C600F
MGGRRRRRWRAVAAGSLALGLAGFAVAFLVVAGSAPDGPAFERLVGYSNLYAFVFAVVPVVGGLCVFVVRELRSPERAGETDPEEEAVGRAAQRLAAAVVNQWRRELVARGLSRAHPLAVTWSVTGRPVTARGGAILPAGAASGEVGELAARFRELPYRQLVVLGAPGAGKSVAAMRLVVDLIEGAEAGEPVPVLLPVSAWDPREPFDDWVARRVREEYPELAGDVAGALVAAGRVTPVLDGLDEMPPGARVPAIEGIDVACDGRPFVLTCRGDEYEAAVVRSGRFLSSAAVVELEPVGAERLVSYLESRVRSGDARWEALFAAVREEPGLAAALSTPLTIYLLLVVYGPPGGEPGELRRLGREEIEKRLLMACLPAVYSRPGTDGAAPWPGVERAERWAGFLASRLRHDGGHDLAWWRFATLDPRLGDPVRVTAAAVAAVAIAVAVATVTTRSALAGVVTGLCTGVVAGSAVAALLSDPTPPKYANLALHGRSRHLARAVRSHFTSWFTAGFAGGAGAGLVTVPLAGLLAGAPSPVSGRLLDGVLYALLAGVAVGLLAGFCGGLVGWLQDPADEVRARDPVTVLRADRAVATVNGAVAGTVCAAAAGPPLIAYAGPVTGTVSALAAATSAAVAVALGTTAWGRFCLARLWLSTQGVLPLRLMRFLADAHNRGLLRCSGGFYQFRHVQLRDHLAAPEPAHPAPRSDTPGHRPGEPGNPRESGIPGETAGDLRDGKSGTSGEAAADSRDRESVTLRESGTPRERAGDLRDGGSGSFWESGTRGAAAGDFRDGESGTPRERGGESRGGSDVGQDGDGGPPVGRGGLTTLAMLAGAVLATSVTTYLTLYQAVPANRDAFKHAYLACEAQLAGGISLIPERAFLVSCLGQFYADQARWVGWGLLALVVVAGALFWLHPVWIVMRNGYRPLPMPAGRDVAAMVERLAPQAGLARPPHLLLSVHPWLTTRVFGRPGRRYLAVGHQMMVLVRSDRQAAEAVVRHALAHLRDGDVDRTYLTIAVWRSFVLLGLLPFVPALLLVADGWAQALRAAVSMATLTALVLLTRAAVLRRSELHADAAAGHRETLHALLTRIPSPRRRLLAWLRSHPDPGRRITHLADPAAVLRPGTWALAGAGMTAAIMAGNVQNFLSGPALLSLLGTALAGLLCVPALVIAIVEAVWLEPSRHSPVPPPRTYLRPAAAVTAGFLLGDQLALAVVFEENPSPVTPARFLLAALMLLTGAALLAGWATSAARTLAPAPPRLQRRAPAAVAAAGTLAAVPWFVVWYAFRRSEELGETRQAVTPGPAHEWLEPLSTLVSLRSTTLENVLVNPLTLPGLLLLWLVPLSLARRRGTARPRTDLAMTTGLAGGVALLLTAAALTVFAADLIPPAVRVDRALPLLYIEIYGLAATLAQALVAFLVATRPTAARPALALFAALVTGVMAASGTRYLQAMAGCVGLYVGPCGVPPSAAPSFVAALIHDTLVKGALTAIPATVIGMAAGTLWRRFRPPTRPTPRPLTRRTRLTQVITMITAAVLIAAAIERIPDFLHMWALWSSGP